MRAALLVCACVLVAACSAPPARDGARADLPRAAEGGAGFPRTVVDGTGRSLTIPSPPQRIVSQTLGTDEMLLDLVPGSRLAGLSPLARDPSYSNIVEQATALGIPTVDSAEEILRLQPDLIFVATYSRAEVTSLLEAGGAPVFRIAAFDRVGDVIRNLQLVATAVGAEAEGERVIAAMRARLDAVRQRYAETTARPRVLSYSDGGFTAGAGTLFDDIVRHAGGTNEAAERGLTGFPKIASEQVLAWNPDYLVAGTMPGEEQLLRQRLLANPAVAATDAARHGRLVLIPNRIFLSVSQHIVDAIEMLAAALHPAGERP